MHAEKFIVFNHIYKEKFSGTFFSGSPAPGVDGGNALSQNMDEAKRCTIIILIIF